MIIDRTIEHRKGERRPGSRVAFSLGELLVAVAIIALLSALTLVGVRAVARDARLSSARNTVEAVLAGARAHAMQENRVVVVAFRTRLINENKQVVEAVTAEYAQSYVHPSLGGSSGTSFDGGVDRFTPVPDIPVRQLAEGTKVAVPFYFAHQVETWLPTAELVRQAKDPTAMRQLEWAGVIPAVMFGPDGTVFLDNPLTDSVRVFVDFDNDGLQAQEWLGGSPFDNISDFPVDDGGGPCYLGEDIDGTDIESFFCQHGAADEPYVLLGPFLAVYDDEEAREIGSGQWAVPGGFGIGQKRTRWQRVSDDLCGPSGYISTRVDRIHFNPFTGVVTK